MRGELGHLAPPAGPAVLGLLRGAHRPLLRDAEAGLLPARLLGARPVREADEVAAAERARAAAAEAIDQAQRRADDADETAEQTVAALARRTLELQKARIEIAELRVAHRQRDEAYGGLPVVPPGREKAVRLESRELFPQFHNRLRVRIVVRAVDQVLVPRA